MDEKAAIEEAVRCRLSLLRYLEDEDRGRMLFLEQMGAFDSGEGLTIGFPPGMMQTAGALRKHYHAELLHAPTWVIEEDVVETLADAWESYPSTTAYSTDVLTPSGFALLARPVPDPEYGDETMAHGIFWTVSDSATGAGSYLKVSDNAQVITIMFLGRLHGLPWHQYDPPRLYPYTSIVWQLDAPGGGHLWEDQVSSRIAETQRAPFVKFLLSLFSIIRDRLAEAQEPHERVKRAADKLKHYRRKQPDLNSTIQVVRFRPRTGSGNKLSESSSGRKLTVRAWTRPFWRMQWYPSTQENKPKLIRSFARGPEGAPEVGRERILLAPKPLKNR
ncbi:hypothetical protein [Nonomuraea typhae]|uniref:Uncharacterized protein n=1 Tax=Nonomuraea typhae TaxID=2603600 RepID=A0ABW7YL03_9ACTN